MNDIRKSQMVLVKSLRRDAKKLETVAKHLRLQAKDIANGVRADLRAEKQQANFYSKYAKVDGKTPIIPKLKEELFEDV
jgi:hypothetical protein